MSEETLLPRLRELRANRSTYKEIAREFKVTPKQVERLCSKHKVPLPVFNRYQGLMIRLTDQEFEDLENLARTMGVTRATAAYRAVAKFLRDSQEAGK